MGAAYEAVFEEKGALTFIGYHTLVVPEEAYRACAAFWDRAYMQRYARLWQTMVAQGPVEEAILANGIGTYALCLDAGGPDAPFEYWIAGLWRGGEVPSGLALHTFPEQTWATFTTTGPIPQSLQALTTYVFDEWLPTEGARWRADVRASVEAYGVGDPSSADYESGIWVPLGRA